MRQIHNIKILKQYADAKLFGDKPWEIRINDRNYQKGDIVCYSVVDSNNNGYVNPVENHPLNEKVFEILYVYSGDGLEKGIVVYTDKDITEDFKANKDKYLK